MDSEKNELQIFDETTTRAQAAYAAFKAYYQEMNPPPKPPVITKVTTGMKQRGMYAALVGGVIVSASHTVPVFLGIRDVSEINPFSAEFIIGLAVFVMAEMALVTFAYSATENEANLDTIGRVNTFTKRGLLFIAILLVLANIYYVLAYRTTIATVPGFEFYWQLFKVTIFLLIGTAAPVIALIVGEILAVDVLRNKSQNRKEQQSYEAAFQVWNEGLGTAWAGAKRKWGGNVDIQVSKPQEPVYLSTSIQTDRQTSGAGFARVSNAVDTAYQWLLDNPEARNKPVRELAEMIGVGKDSVSKAKKRFGEPTENEE